MGVSIDLRKAHSAFRYGDINVVLSWLNDQRAMFLIPAIRARAPWFIVLEPVAFEWNDQDPNNLIYLIDRAAKACEVMGIEPSQRNCHRIIAIVNDRMQDFVRMPSQQPAEKLSGSFGRVQLREGGVVMHEADIRLDDDGVTYG